MLTLLYEMVSYLISYAAIAEKYVSHLKDNYKEHIFSFLLGMIIAHFINDILV